MLTPVHRRHIARAMRTRSHVAVRHYLANREEMLRRLGAKNLGELRTLYRNMRSLVTQGHWAGCRDRLEGLRQAILAERYAARFL
jgi:hypothetical protein